MAEPVKLLTIQFLAWLASRPRTYAEVRDAWKSTCPLNSAWEDALAAGLVRCENGAGKSADDSAVVLTDLGRIALDGNPTQSLTRAATRA